MIPVLKIAWRSIWRNRRRTILGMTAVGVGLMLIILYTGLMTGITAEAREGLDDVGLGHVEVTAAGWRGKHLATQSMAAVRLRAPALGLPADAEVSARVLARALVSSAHGSQSVEVAGVDWDQERLVASHLRTLAQGELPGPGDDRRILVGEKLAARLKLGLGSKVRVLAQRADGEIGAELWRVGGIFRSLSTATSERKAYVSAAAARSLLGVGEVAHQLVVQLPRAADADEVQRRLAAQLGPEYEVLTYGELMPMLREMEDLMDLVVWIAAFFIYGLVGLGILNTLLMSVLERTREFGVLRALGTRPGRMVAQVFAESFWIATLSGVLGLAAGLLLNWYGSEHALMNIGGADGHLEYLGSVVSSARKTHFSVPQALQAAALVYVMALVTALFPAWKVARLPPAVALRAN